jgi:hypothetical protein
LIEISTLVFAKIQIGFAGKKIVNSPEKNESKVINFINNHQEINNFLTFLKSYLEIITGYYSICLFYYIHKGWSMANQKPHFENHKNHVGIIVNIYHDYFGREYCFGFGVDLLIKFFDNKTPYSVYRCRTKEDFFNIVSNPRVTSIWIFGHGDHGGIRCGDGMFDYRELFGKLSPNFPKKESIYQMHCNDGNLPALVDLLANGRGFVNNSKNYPYGLRHYVNKILNDC